MKQLTLSMLALALCTGVFAQADTTKPKTGDTIRVGNMIIIKKDGGNTTEEKTDKKSNDDDGVTVEIKKRKTYKPSNISTNWLVVDLGFANVNDQTNYSGPAAIAYLPGGDKNSLGLKNGKSSNVNLWFFMQRVNVIKHVINYFDCVPEFRSDFYAHQLINIIMYIKNIHKSKWFMIYFLLKNIGYFRIGKIIETIQVRKMVGPSKKIR